ncbi:MAG TPA: hypothetical protein VJU61_23125 [Polyangiaceae bacterium]|nr:hypothetical protein [Polyangiaceae bacterium]
MRRRQAVPFALALSACCLPPALASAEPAVVRSADSDRARAEQYAAAAFEAYGRKQYVEAVALYQKAYALTPNADIILYNIARIYDAGLHDSKLAIDYYLRYAAAAGAAPNRLQISSQRIAQLATSDPPLAKPVATRSAAEPHAAELAAAQDRGASARDTAAVSLVTAPGAVSRPAQSPVPSPVPSSPASSEWTARELTALTVGGLGVVGIGLGVVFGLSTSAQADTWEQYCDGDVCTSQKGVDAAESATRQAQVATVSLTAGLTLTALGTVLWFMGGPSENPAETRTEARSETRGGVASLRLLPIAGDGEFGGSLSGRF